MKRCIECGKELVDFAFDTGREEVWECRYCGARYIMEGDYGELVRFFG